MPITSIPLGPIEFWMFGLVAVPFILMLIIWGIDRSGVLVRRILLAGLATLLVAATVLLLWDLVSAHPGRLNSEGCHNVHKDWEYKDGRIVKAGTYHCHRLLGAMRLDGLEMLQDPNDPGEEKETKAGTETWLDWFRSFFNGG